MQVQQNPRDNKPKGSPVAIVAASVVVVGVIAAVIMSYYSGKESASLEYSPTPTPSILSTRPPGNNTNTQGSTPPNVRPERLIEIIREQQHNHVRESYGQGVGENFSDRDLQEFIKKGTPANIVRQLQTNVEFLEVVSAVKNIAPAERQKLFERALRTYRPTWAEFGRVDPQGQTSAGQTAEKMIAQAIVDKVKELSRQTGEATRPPSALIPG